MKKVILGSVLAVSAVSAIDLANAAVPGTQAICAGQASAYSSTVSIVTQGTNTEAFVKTAFTPKCSANVHLVGNDQGTYYGAGAVSSKGKNSFVGSTAGGGVKANTSCAAATGCTSAEAETAAVAAPAS